MERITADMIAEKEFSIESKGYNKNEVDNFLDEICEEMDRLNNEIFDLRQKTTMVRPQAPAESSAPTAAEESRFREILEMAAQVKEETIRRAKEDAEAIRVKAETEATERLEGLQAERDELKTEIENLKQTAADYRRQFEELLHAQQEALEKATGLF
jgi:cell division initiation protein